MGGIGLYKEFGKKIINNTSGYSVFELLTVAIIIAIAVAVAIPNMSGWFGNKSMLAMTRQMFTDMQRARSMAIANYRPVSIMINCPNNWYQILDTNGTVIVPPTYLPQGITFGKCSFPLSVTFNTAGINQRGFSTLNAQGAVEILSSKATASDHSNDVAIVLDPGGSMQILSYKEPGWPW